MTAIDFITELFCKVDDGLSHIRPEYETKLSISEIVTIGLLYALKGRGQRAFYRWLVANHKDLFPNLPERTRLFRNLATYRVYADEFLACPTMIGVIDSYGIELIHPRREGRSENQIGKKGKSNLRWIVGGKLCFVLNRLGQVIDWGCDGANVYDGSAFQSLVDKLRNDMVVFSDAGFVKSDWFPSNLRTCQRGEWNVCMVVETILSMLTRICNFKHMTHRSWKAFETRLGYTMALFNILVAWHGFSPQDDGFVPLSIVEFDIL